MDHLQKLTNQLRLRISIAILLSNAGLALAWYLCHLLKFSGAAEAAVLIIVAAALSAILSFSLGKAFTQPTKAIWQAVKHLHPDSGVNQDEKPLAPKSLQLGRELVSDLLNNIYELISSADKLSDKTSLELKELSHNFIAQNLPLPLLILDHEQTIKYTNRAAATYLGFQEEDLIGKNVYMIMDMAFPSQDTFDNWLKHVRDNNATASSSWERVKLDVRDNHPELLFDMAAYYNRDNSDGNETMLILFDHTKQYAQDEQAISYVALSVHELRAPLTLLRGYIEVFEEELGDQLSPELASFMEKMHAQAEQLMAFVNNILNVARIDDDQLQLKLEETDWAKILRSSIDSINIRAKVRGIRLNSVIADDLPSAAVDRLSIQEVISNLVDNAIKYSGKSHDINIESHLNSDGFIETSIQDFGVGISTAALPNLFTKFYRDHHNRSQIGGTGLGLYLSKAIVQAHGGNIWVRSKQAEGSTFSFTIKPYSQFSKDKASEEELTAEAHGWIKNHSLYRR